MTVPTATEQAKSSGARVGVVNGTVVTDSWVGRADLVIEQAHIAEVRAPGSSTARLDEIIDARDRLVMPGAVDVHTHLEDLLTSDREDFRTGTMAAAAGGITTVVEHPLSAPPTITAALYRDKRELAESKVVVDFGLWGALTPESLSEMRDQWREGALGFKAFLTDSHTEFKPVSDSELLDGLGIAAELDALVLVHAENEAIVQASTAAVQAAGRRDGRAHHDSRPPLAEEEASARAILLASSTGTRLQVVHVTLPEVAARVAQAKRAGARVTMEVCPHHLLLDLDDAQRLGPYGRCAPPLRRRSSVEGLWRCVRDGGVDCLVSDHSTYTVAEKERGREDIFEAGLGCQVIQESVPLTLSAALHERNVSLQAFVAMACTRPAQIAGYYPKKGAIAPGSDADLMLVDPDCNWVVHADAQQFNKNRWSPFEGRSCRVRIDATLVRGRTVFRDGEIVAPPGWGRFLPGPGRAPQVPAPPPRVRARPARANEPLVEY